MDNSFFNAAPLAYLSDSQLKALHQASVSILEEIGSVVCHEPTLKQLEKNGVRISGKQHAFIPESLVNWAIEQAPKSITIFNRQRQPAMHLHGTNVYFGTGSDCRFLSDTNGSELREFGLDDMVNALKLADALPHIDFVMCMALAAELEAGSSCAIKYAAMLSHTSKPLVVVSGPELSQLDNIVKAAALIPGDREELANQPTFLLLVNPTSPLLHSQDAIEKLVYMAESRLPLVYAPGIMAGASSPITIAGAIAQANAEILAGLVIHQLTRPGAPFVFGGGMSPLDMKSGQPTYAAPEAMVSQAGLCQLGRSLYHLPTWGFGGCSASKICDEQAVAEASNYLMMSAWMGTNLVHDIGYLEFGVTYSLELLTICDEIIGQIRHLMKGIVVDEEHLALEAIKRVGPMGNFLADAHTMENYKNNWQPDLIDRKTRSVWEKKGSLSLLERAAQKVIRILDHHCPDPLPSDIAKQLHAICGYNPQR